MNRLHLLHLHKGLIDQAAIWAVHARTSNRPGALQPANTRQSLSFYIRQSSSRNTPNSNKLIHNLKWSLLSQLNKLPKRGDPQNFKKMYAAVQI